MFFLKMLITALKTLSAYAIHIVVGVIIIALVIIAIAAIKKYYRKWERLIDSLPSWASTVGVLGTFLGITAGLVDFDTNPQFIDDSIRTLLDGLKTAFYTSLAGMLGSWVLSIIIDRLFDRYNSEQPSSETEAIKDMTSALSSFSTAMAEQSRQTVKAFNEFTASMNQMRSDVQSINSQILSQSERQLQILENIATGNTNLTTSVNSLTNETGGVKSAIESLSEETRNVKTAVNTLENVTSDGFNVISSTAKKMSESLTGVDNATGEMQDILSAMSPQFTMLAEHVQNQNEVMRGYIDDILTGMLRTNQLLTQKFDEFTELMKKSNTEALKEAMENALAKLNEQMSDLINRLITDNFTRLTECVDQLATWQRENKEMVSALTKQYHQMEMDFEGTSTSLSEVKDSVHSLTYDGGKLSQIVSALNQVMIEDERFVQMTTNLTEAAATNKQTTEAFNEEVNALNEWVRKQRNFADAVNALIATLNDLSSIKNYSDQFWSDTKKGMNDGVAILTKGSRSLQSQIEGMNNVFYERLSATLSNLDACIRAIMDNNHRR